MKQRKRLRGFQKHRSRERLAEVERNWKYLSFIQQMRITLIIYWHATPTLYQIINHIKYFGRRHLERLFYPAHWLK